MNIGNIKKDDKEYKAMQWQICLAKLDNDKNPGATVFVHSALAYHVAKGLLKKHINKAVKKFLPKNVLFLVSTHDVGKISPGFQNKICPSFYISSTGHVPLELEFETLHPIVGASSLRSMAGEYSDVSGGHHGVISKDDRSPANISFGGNSWEDERQKFIKAIAEYVEKDGGCITNKKRKNVDISIGACLYLTTYADWIASSSDYFDQSSNEKALEENIKKIPSVLKKLEEATEINKSLCFSQIFDGKKMNRLQEACSKVKNGEVVIIEDSMGGGKTEAALWLAYLLDNLGVGMYYALPTKITSNGIYKRVESFINSVAGGSGVNLIHGDSWMEPISSDPPEVPYWYHPSKRALLSKFGVGTIDQGLLSILNVKHNYMRLFGLAGKVVIFDEVHSYDAYTSTILFKLVDTLKKVGCKVIILSATLNKKTKERLLGVKISDKKSTYPLITYLKTGSKTPKYISFPPTKSRKVKIVFGDMNYEEAIAFAKKGYRVLIIRNTSGKAQRTYKKLKSLSDESFEIGILHAKFTNEIRTPLEERYIGIYGKGSTYDNGFILVATQVVEQSLDIDSDYLYTDFCPSDLFLQRLGRLWRHDRKRTDGAYPCVTIIMPEIVNGRYKYDVVYDDYICSRSMEVLKKFSEISLPEDIRDIVEDTYRDRKESGLLMILKNKLELKNRDLEDMAIGGTKTFAPMLSDDERASTRHSAYPSRTLAIVKDFIYVDKTLKLTMLDGSTVSVYEDKDKKMDFKEMVKLCKNLVSVPFGKKMLEIYVDKSDKFSKEMCKSMPFALDAIVKVASDGSMYYDRETNKPTLLGWSSEIGVYKLGVEEESSIG